MDGKWTEYVPFHTQGAARGLPETNWSRFSQERGGDAGTGLEKQEWKKGLSMLAGNSHPVSNDCNAMV
jgi:hypothetical protein